MPRTVTICGRECAVLDGKWNAKAGRWDLTVECPLPTCKARRRDTGIPKHLDDHDRSRDRAELKRNKIGSYVKPIPGQLGLPGTGVKDVDRG